MSDAVEVAGLEEVLDEDEELAYLELRLRCRDRTFRAAILRGEEEWTLNLRDERGRSLPGSGELYATQADTIVAALLLALEVSRQRLP